MFPGSRAATRKEQRKIFALDVKVRCHRIHSDMHRMHNGNTRKVASLLLRHHWIAMEVSARYAGTPLKSAQLGKETGGKNQGTCTQVLSTIST